MTAAFRPPPRSFEGRYSWGFSEFFSFRVNTWNRTRPRNNRGRPETGAPLGPGALPHGQARVGLQIFDSRPMGSGCASAFACPKKKPNNGWQLLFLTDRWCEIWLHRNQPAQRYLFIDAITAKGPWKRSLHRLLVLFVLCFPGPH